MTLRHKLLLWYTGVLAVSGFVLMSALYLFTAHQMHREVDKFLADECDEMIAMLPDALGGAEDLLQAFQAQGRRNRYFKIAFRLYDPAQQENVWTQGNAAWQLRLVERFAFTNPGLKKTYSSIVVGRHGYNLRVLTQRARPEDPGSLVLQGGIYLRRLEIRLVRLRIFLALALASGVGLAYVGGNFLAGRSLKPMNDIVTELSSIEANRLAARLAEPGTTDEVARLRATINAMLERLEDAFEQMRAFTADAAHELRTPVAALRCRLEVALDEMDAASPEEDRQVLADTLSETEQLGRTIDDLLLLARMDAQAKGPEFEQVQIAELLEEVGDVFKVAAQERGLQLRVECASTCPVRGNPTLLRRLYGNLIDNAIRYTPSGGTVKIVNTVEGSSVLTRIMDTGIGIPPESQDKVFQRFVRTEKSRSREAGGAGLGLSICKSIVELHSGSLTLESEPGKGSVFEVRLPVT